MVCLDSLVKEHIPFTEILSDVPHVQIWSDAPITGPSYDICTRVRFVQRLIRRELEPWETVVVGAISGGLTAVTTTPFDVTETRIMTTPVARNVSMSAVAFSILRDEGPLALFKGSVPRFFWIVPLGAMNFAGYKLLRKATHLRVNIWFEATTAVAVAPSAEIQRENVLKSAFAGGLSRAFSSAVMHPVDTVKTEVQASTTLTFPDIMSKIPQIGLRGLYKGSIPATLRQFSSHGLRTGICDVSKLVLINVAPNLPDIPVESMALFFNTVVGTVARLPCEVLKQCLQAPL
ncbi:mitochondrial thiamine pyrophosphate carrier 1 [Gossypium arboreum]|uniref:mitochondrial thiamine pyrophosphate carrier 1 n=1 Tax=Gossypium arboreum TaxID=29729 RepID=UPI0008194C1A|nr:mitochondrial thiamine pyrophosphate carrier 1 [Gossypium arboreum]